MRIVGYHISDGTITDTDNRGSRGLTPLEYLLEPKKDTIRILFHLEHSVANLLRIIRLAEEAGRELLLTTNLHISPYRLRYVPYKFFSIKRSGAFSYYSNANQYMAFPNSLLLENPLELANKAKEVGEEVYQVLKDLGLEATSLINPIRAYEKNPTALLPIEQINWLYKEKEEAGEIKRHVIQRIICGIVEKELDTNNKEDRNLIPITLDIAIKKNQWNELGKLV